MRNKISRSLMIVALTLSFTEIRTLPLLARSKIDGGL
jgi:hypothetical protein